MRKRKIVTMQVTVSCPTWLPAAAARREVRSLINNQAHWGHVNRDPRAEQHASWEEISEYNFRARKIKGVK